jgi:hypothetical protein
VIRCLRCVIPDTRPDTAFVNGICSACIAYEQRPQIDWQARERALVELLNRFNGECIVPSSGGKDSHYQVLELLKRGADVTVVTATTCHLTPVGRLNIDNLKRYAKTVEVSPNATVRAKLNRIGLTMVGDISWPEHVSIFTTPMVAARDLRRPLIFYGENPQNQYGGPLDSQEAKTMNRRWRSEFGGFLGLRPQDLIGVEGLGSRDLVDYVLPADIDQHFEAHFLGQYLPWDSHRNAEIAKAAGMRQVTPSITNWWSHENLDNGQTGIHDHGMYRKYGFGRFAAQLSVDVRAGLMTREGALALVKARDGRFPYWYAGVELHEVLERIGMTATAFWEALDKHTNWNLFDAKPGDKTLKLKGATHEAAA